MGREKGRKYAIRWGEMRGLLGFGRGELHVRRTSEAGCEHAVCMCTCALDSAAGLGRGASVDYLAEKVSFRE